MQKDEFRLANMPSMLFSQCYGSTLSLMSLNSHFINMHIQLPSVLKFTLHSLFFFLILNKNKINPM